jgi:hypothetical protein
MHIGKKGLFFPEGESLGQLAFVTGGTGGEGQDAGVVLAVFPNSGAMGIKTAAEDGSQAKWADGRFEGEAVADPSAVAGQLEELRSQIAELRSRLDPIGTGSALGGPTSPKE